MKNQYTQLLLTAGLVLGVLYSVATYISYIFNAIPVITTISGMLGFGSIAYVLMTYGKRAAAIKDVDGAGFSYGQAFGFSILTLLLSGIIVGINTYILQNFIDPVYFDEQFRIGLETLTIKSEAQLEMMMKTQEFMKNIFVMIILMSLAMVFWGGLMALFTSIFIKRSPKIF